MSRGGAASHISDCGIFVDARLEVLEDGWIDAGHGAQCSAGLGRIGRREGMSGRGDVNVCCALQTIAKIQSLCTQVMTKVNTVRRPYRTSPSHIGI